MSLYNFRIRDMFSCDFMKRSKIVLSFLIASCGPRSLGAINIKSLATISSSPLPSRRPKRLIFSHRTNKFHVFCHQTWGHQHDFILKFASRVPPLFLTPDPYMILEIRHWQAFSKQWFILDHLVFIFITCGKRFEKLWCLVCWFKVHPSPAHINPFLKLSRETA